MGENQDINDAVSAEDMEMIEPTEEQPPPPIGDEHVPVDTDPDEDGGETGDEELGQDDEDDVEPDGGPVEDQ